MTPERRLEISEDIAAELRPAKPHWCEDGKHIGDHCGARATFWSDDVVPGKTVWMCDRHADEFLMRTDGGAVNEAGNDE